ncbi:MAG TPA: thiamine pyrophosphate-binding protein [Pirellulales bacterium]|nr:thiamine pyrophosphate-binding protein [Pirellulales bacterium]
MFSGSEIADLLAELKVTHVIWLPDSGLGAWENALEESSAFQLIRVSRESEAWAIAAGLDIGGARPMVIMQTTGLFDSGDSFRNALFDLGRPLFAIVGHRSYLIENSADTAKHFAEPILRAWEIDYVLLARPDELPRMGEHYRASRAAGKPGIALVAEGRM